MVKNVQYDKVSALTKEDLEGIEIINILINEADTNSVAEVLKINENGSFTRIETYSSLKEFATVASKELLTLYAKRQTIKSDTNFFKEDDPRLHAFLSKLSYPAIEMVCKNLPEFSKQFVAGKVTMNLPSKHSRK